MNEFEDDKLVIVLVHNGNKVQAGVALVHDFVLLVVNEIAHFGLTCDDHLVYLLSNFMYFFEEALLLHL